MVFPLLAIWLFNKRPDGKDERKAGREEDKQEDSKCVIWVVELRQPQVRSPMFSSFIFLNFGNIASVVICLTALSLKLI